MTNNSTESTRPNSFKKIDSVLYKCPECDYETFREHLKKGDKIPASDIYCDDYGKCPECGHVGCIDSTGPGQVKKPANARSSVKVSHKIKNKTK